LAAKRRRAIQTDQEQQKYKYLHGGVKVLQTFKEKQRIFSCFLSQTSSTFYRPRSAKLHSSASPRREPAPTSPKTTPTSTGGLGKSRERTRFGALTESVSLLDPLFLSESLGYEFSAWPHFGTAGKFGRNSLEE
jgi:hypothetical protein